jgi:hypothetical protein
MTSTPAYVPYRKRSHASDDTPDREMIGLLPYCIVAAAAAQAFAAGIVTLFGGSVLATGIIDDRVMVFACLTGAAFGSFVSISFFPPKNPCARTLAIKLLASSAFSMIVSPYIIEKWFTPTPALVLFVSGMNGMFAFSAATLLRRKWLQLIGSKSSDEQG